MRVVLISVDVTVLAAGLLAGAGCASVGSAAGLEDVDWRLAASSVSSSDLGAAGITARFEDGLVGGTGGVNSYGASYEIKRAGGSEIGIVTSTLIAAVDEEANAAEAAYFGLLPRVAGYEVEGETLTLSDAGGNVLLVFERGD
jgi:heat shock protein HslJ